MKDKLLKAVYAYLANKAVDWADQGVDYLLKKIKTAEKNIPGSGKGAVKWDTVWHWILGESGEEITEHKDDIKSLVSGIVSELNKSK